MPEHLIVNQAVDFAKALCAKTPSVTPNFFQLIAMTNLSPTPKVFISYSWTSEEHTQWVGELGERLMSDGIDVVLDQWSLEDGHDVNAFMEQMVTDPSIKRVIVVCDSLYAEKADGRKGGVGTETQIISKKVYESVEQTKFVPLLRERDESGKPCLPVFLHFRRKPKVPEAFVVVCADPRRGVLLA